jgi:hypothetical protein
MKSRPSINIPCKVYIFLTLFAPPSADNVSPRTSSMRLTFVALYITSYLLLSYYSAAFITDLTLQDPALPFTSFEELLGDKSYMLGMIRKSAQMDYFKVSYPSILYRLQYVWKYWTEQTHESEHTRIMMQYQISQSSTPYSWFVLGFMRQCILTELLSVFLAK